MKKTIFVLICIIITLCPCSSSIITDSGSNVNPSDIELNESFKKIYEELISFDLSETIVFYRDSDGKKRIFSPINEMKNIKEEKSESKLLSKSYKALDPGSILNISIDFINSVQHHIISILYKKFKSFDLPLDILIPGVEINNIHANLKDLKVENLNLLLSKSDNSIILAFSDLHFDTVADLHIKKFGISENGKVGIQVYLDELIVKVFFEKDTSSDLMIPKLSVKLVEIKIPSDQLKITLNLDYVPSMLINYLITFIQSTVLKKIEDYLTKFISGQGTSDLNKLIRQNYPSNVSIIEKELQISTLLTDKINIGSNRIMIALDALAYKKSKGKGKRQFPSKMIFTNEDGNDIVFGISQESLGSVFKTYISDIKNNQYHFEHGHIKADFKTNFDDYSFLIWESGMSLNKLLFNGTINYLGFTFDMNFKMDAKFEVENIDFVKKQILVTVKKTELSDYAFNSNIPLISSFGQYLKPFIEVFANYFKNYAIPCPSLTLPYLSLIHI